MIEFQACCKFLKCVQGQCLAMLLFLNPNWLNITDFPSHLPLTLLLLYFGVVYLFGTCFCACTFCIWLCVCTHMYIHVCTWMLENVCMHMCCIVYVNVFAHMYVCMCLHVCMCVYISMCNFVCMCVYLCVMYFLFLVLWKYTKIILPLLVIILADLEVEIEIFSKEKWEHKVVSNLLNYFFESFCNLWIASFVVMSWLLSICFSLKSRYWVYMTYNASFYVHTLWHIFMSG